MKYTKIPMTESLMKSARQTFRNSTIVIAMSFVSLFAQAQNVIQAVSSSTQSGVEVIKIDLTQALSAPPAGFSIQAPARVVLDLPNVGSGSLQSAININQGNVRSANVIQAGDRTHVLCSI